MVLKSSFIIISLLIGAPLIVVSVLRGESASSADGACITTACHTGMGKDKFVHGPVAAGECEACHGSAPGHALDPGAHKFPKPRKTPEICFECHDPFPKKQFAHGPYEEGECTACHSPHGSPNKYQLVAKGSALCLTCHDEALVGGAFVHGPVAVGSCTACHDPHTASYARNLRAQQPDLCLGCHTDKADSIHNSQFVHKPVAEKCTSCHNPHSNAKQYMLPAGAPELCLGCHKDKKDYLANVSTQHGAIQTEKSCLNCHDAHASNIAHNLQLPTMDLCIKCHDREYKQASGKTLINMKKWLADNADHHGPIRQKDCSGCHNPHGSDNFRILRRPYPPTFYESFSPEKYDLCFGCHEKSMVLTRETTTLTNFRNGSTNLHFVHVNKIPKGRTCRACHETHASNFPKHIREAVPFGGWELPISYQKVSTGGGCSPGCHVPRKYDRDKAVVNP